MTTPIQDPSENRQKIRELSRVADLRIDDTAITHNGELGWVIS
jgi:hypothetical protein